MWVQYYLYKKCRWAFYLSKSSASGWIVQNLSCSTMRSFNERSIHPVGMQKHHTTRTIVEEDYVHLVWNCTKNYPGNSKQWHSFIAVVANFTMKIGRVNLEQWFWLSGLPRQFMTEFHLWGNNEKFVDEKFILVHYTSALIEFWLVNYSFV